MKLYTALWLVILMGASGQARGRLVRGDGIRWQEAALGQFGIKACALVDQAVWDAKGMSPRWYRIAAQVLRLWAHQLGCAGRERQRNEKRVRRF